MCEGPRDVDADRRRLLASVAGVALSGALAGCSSEEAEEPDGTDGGESDDGADGGNPRPTDTPPETDEGGEGGEETPAETPESVGPWIEIVEVRFGDREIIEGEAIEVAVDVENEGDETGIHTVELTADGEVVRAEDVRVEPEERETVTFRLTITSPGEYEVGAGDETVTVLVEPEPPEFEVREATVETETSTGEPVEARTTVDNTGGPGTFEAEFLIDGEVVDEIAVDVDRESEETVTFTHSFDERGRYEVGVAGEDAGTVAVEGCETLVAETETVGWRESLRYAIEFEEEGSVSIDIETDTGRAPTLTITDPSGEAIVDGRREERLDGEFGTGPGEYDLLLENTATFPFSDGRWVIGIEACSVGAVARTN
ncbi:CARDB domain-containing protein [Natronorarus salvus]|uniref:CARDB domain-containing protein n=1 Tax=Natronorarus salvus TaxID=3117733 RepID=UPI002F26CA64